MLPGLRKRRQMAVISSSPGTPCCKFDMIPLMRIVDEQSDTRFWRACLYATKPRFVPVQLRARAVKCETPHSGSSLGLRCESDSLKIEAAQSFPVLEPLD